MHPTLAERIVHDKYSVHVCVNTPRLLRTTYVEILWREDYKGNGGASGRSAHMSQTALSDSPVLCRG